MNVNQRKPNRRHARSIARNLLKTCCIISAPVKISYIVKQLDMDTQKGNPNILNLAKISAFIDLEDKIVVYNDSHPTVRKRFSFAHEIGHFLLNHTLGNDIFNLDSSDPREIEANMFAAELLIPFEWIKQDMLISGMNIKELATKYWVSELAMGWRLYKSDSLLLT